VTNDDDHDSTVTQKVRCLQLRYGLFTNEVSYDALPFWRPWRRVCCMLHIFYL